MIFASLALAALAVLPSDRMGMADRLFDRGAYRDARGEYAALAGAEGIAADELLYRLAECDRALGDSAAARREYGELLDRHPMSRHAERARLMRALAGSDAEKRAELKMLDTDGVSAPVRASALYHLGVLDSDRGALERSAKLDPKGPYAVYAKFRHATLALKDADQKVRRAAAMELMDIHFGGDKEMAREALYVAATAAYSDKRWGESSSLLRRYLKVYPGDAREGDARTMAAWSDYLSAKYADAAALCGEGRTDDSAYLLGACALATGDRDRARVLFRKYLDAYPHGRYRSAAELPLARMEFEEAEKGGDQVKTIEAARRSALLSGGSADALRLAWAYEKAGRVDEAKSAYAAVARDFPKTDDAAEALFRAAMVEIRDKKWSAAELMLAESLASGANAPRRAEALYWRGIAANMLGHDAEACGFLAEALKLGLSLDESREARLVIADRDFKEGRTKEAKASYAALVREGACERMSAAKIRSVGRFLLECREGAEAFEEAKACAKALAANGGTSEWRQSAYALRGAAEEASGEFTAAVESYRKAMAETARTEELREVALSLGILESKAGDHARADAALKEAVKLNSADASRRARSYLWLARNSEAMTDYRGACAYATVVTTLFDDPGLVAEAKKILAAHPEEAK